MRIQHNIMAMNAYRNYTNNTTALSQNLEKLSSGYKINRAGDDAAGLAISEKMRAQITGLEQAQDNAKSGKNLVNTAEGALQEVHDMLNRMVKLADQSANGTFDDEVDRAALQDEIVQLKDEIDRIADSANYNGIKLLNGDLASGNASNVTLADTAAVAATATTGDFAAATGSQAAGETFSYTVAWKQGDKEYSATVNFKVGTDTTKLIAEDGTSYTITATAAATEIQDAVLAELKKNSQVSSAFDITKTGTAGLKFTSKVVGADGAEVTALNSTVSASAKLQAATTTYTSTDGVDAMQKLDHSKFVVATGATAITAEDLEDMVFELGGKKFILAANTAVSDTFKNLDADVNIIRLKGAAYNATNDAANVAKELSRITGMEFEAATANGPSGAGYSQHDILYKGSEPLSTANSGLTLQIGDTSDSFNQLTVSIQDMHVSSLGLSAVSVADAKSAQAAVDVIKNAINTVSTVRGNLGAASNRLDHTMNNLSVMTENIQDAESTIRDTDVADEMMAYTKNNILVQSAQAMLAQANQVPQGVLQLLQ